jgi:hypothetical protein
MDFDEFAATIGRQFVTALNAPVPFLAAVLAVGILMRWYFANSYATRINNGISTEKLLERQLQEYKDKTGGETPDAVKARIEALEQRIGEIGPRKISLSQRQSIATILSPFKGAIVEVTSDAGSADAAQMSKGLVSAFNSAGWEVQISLALGLGNPPPSGVSLRVPDPSNLSPEQDAIARAFRSCKIEFDCQTEPFRDRFPIANPSAVVILTTRLED